MPGGVGVDRVPRAARRPSATASGGRSSTSAPGSRVDRRSRQRLRRRGRREAPATGRAPGPRTPSTSRRHRRGPGGAPATSRASTAPAPAVPPPAARIDRGRAGGVDGQRHQHPVPPGDRRRLVDQRPVGASGRRVGPEHGVARRSTRAPTLPSSGRHDSTHWIRCTSEPSRARAASTRAQAAIRESWSRRPSRAKLWPRDAPARR